MYHIFQRAISKIFLLRSDRRKFEDIIRRKGFHHRYRFAGWQSLVYPLSNNELLLKDKHFILALGNEH